VLRSGIASDRIRTAGGPPETEPGSATHAAKRPGQGLRAIIAYKTVKATGQLGLASLLLCLWPFGLTERVESAARTLLAHTTHLWARHLSELLLQDATPKALALVLLALALDGTFTAFEAFALRRGYAWARWLVVVATSLLLPFELFELLEAPHLSRLAILLVNAGIAAYLARSALRENPVASL
jgi:uncharacterized membrane protein (DUF2068 family)